MNSIIKSASLLTLACLAPLQAQVTETTKTEETSRSSNGTVTGTTTTTVQTFNPEVRTKVVTYFDSFKGNRHGLPPAFAKQVRVKEIPSTWRTTRISPGVVVTETQRPYLVEAPADLVAVMPAAPSGVHYYVAGSNVVAVDAEYRVIDSVQIPTVKYTENEDEVVIESKEGGTTTKTEIDKDDGEVEVEKEKDD